MTFIKITIVIIIFLQLLLGLLGCSGFRGSECLRVYGFRGWFWAWGLGFSAGCHLIPKLQRLGEGSLSGLHVTAADPLLLAIASSYYFSAAAAVVEV